MRLSKGCKQGRVWGLLLPVKNGTHNDGKGGLVLNEIIKALQMQKKASWLQTRTSTYLKLKYSTQDFFQVLYISCCIGRSVGIDRNGSHSFKV
jgi:hypothetical protein